MQDYQMTLGMHKRAKDPELKPFLLEGGPLMVLFCILILFPVGITTLTILAIIFLDQILILLLLSIVGLIYLLCALILANSTYKQLKQYQITGSLVQDLFRLIETFGFRIQSAIFPLIFLFFIFSLLFTPGENGEGTDFIGIAVQLFGAIIPFIAIILILNTFVNYRNDYNDKVSSLADRVPEEEFRLELKKWGRDLGFTDVKIRLADLIPNYFGRVAIGAQLNNIVYIGYSKIAQYQAERDQSLVYCVREICRLSLENRWRYYLFYSIHNILFSLYLGLSGLLIFSLSWEFPIIQEPNFIMYCLVIIVLFIADLFTKAYLGSFDILLELKTDQKTVEVLTTDSRSSESIRRYLRLTEDVDPLMTTYLGFKFRHAALLEGDQRKSVWDDL